MSKQTIVSCDQCGKQLNEITSEKVWGLRLESKNFGENPNGWREVEVRLPILKEPLDFCSKKCLANWMRDQNWPEPSVPISPQDVSEF